MTRIPSLTALAAVPFLPALAVLAVPLVGCAEVVPTPTPRAPHANGARPDTPATALSSAGESTPAPRTALAGPPDAAPLAAPLVGAPPDATRDEAREPAELLADPAAGDEELARWYRGTDDRSLFRIHFELAALLAERGDEHPLRAELQWLAQELDRRASELERVVAATPRRSDFAERYAAADLEELAWWSWSKYRDLRAHRKQTGNELEFR